MPVYENVLDLIGNTPLVDVSALSPEPRRAHPRQAGEPEPVRLGQGPHRHADDRDGREGRRCSARARRSSSRRRATPASPWPRSPSSRATRSRSCCRRTCRSSAARCSRSSAPRSSSRPATEGSQRRRAPGPGAGRGAPRVVRSSTSTATTPTRGRTTRAPVPRSGATVPEITHFVAGLGTSGTLMGVGTYLKEQNPDIKVSPSSRRSASGSRGCATSTRATSRRCSRQWGGRELLDRKRIVRPRESLEWTRRLVTECGIFAGISSGAALAGAVKVAERDRRGRRSCSSSATAAGSTCRPAPTPTTSTRPRPSAEKIIYF